MMKSSAILAKYLALLCYCACLCHFADSLDNGLAKTPPMGWMAWERFTCQVDCNSYPDDCIDENLFYRSSKLLVEHGFRDSGYKYVQVDDCWSEHQRDPISSRLIANRTRFPGGMKKLADHMHQLGLKLGLYGDCGEKTCGGYPAQLKPGDRRSKIDPNDDYSGSYFKLDAETLDSWQVDAFKFDGCYVDPIQAESICPMMARALNGSAGQGRHTLLICEWPFYMMYAHAEPNYTLAAEACNAWRYFDDIEDSWWSILNTIDHTIRHQSTIVKYHGPGHWFDPDQLVIGNFGLSRYQAQAQMAIWSIWSAPLFMSNDLRTIDVASASLLKNENLIRVNQDPLGVLGLMVLQSDDRQLQAFVKPTMPVRNGCPSFAIVYLNRRSLGGRSEVTFKLRDLLTGAAIHQAAKHQLEAGVQGGADAINAAECLKRLHRAMSQPSAPSTSYRSPDSWSPEPLERLEVRYDAVDMLDSVNLGTISLSDQLTLQVAPSGVRAVQLVEKLQSN